MNTEITYIFVKQKFTKIIRYINTNPILNIPVYVICNLQELTKIWNTNNIDNVFTIKQYHTPITVYFIGTTNQHMNEISNLWMDYLANSQILRISQIYNNIQ